MEKTEVLLKDYTDEEKGAYFGAIASLATADKAASEEELEHIMELADAAEVSEEQKEGIVQAAKEISGDELKKCLDILKNSDLRFSLVTDLISFAESDKNYSPEEKTNVEKIAQYLNINKDQFSSLDEFVKKTAGNPNAQEEMKQPGFLSALGLDEKFKNSGINLKSITKGLLGIAGPMILASLVGRGLGGGRGNSLGRSGFGMPGGGLGSLISSLSGGRGFSNIGGLLSRVLGRNSF